jgi:hypothetical protein
MKIISFYQPVVIQSETGNATSRMAVNPFERIVVNDDTAIQIQGGGDWRCPKCGRINSKADEECRAIAKDGTGEQCKEPKPLPAPVEHITDFWPFYLNNVQRPANFRGKRVLFYRGRGIGDQLISSALSRFFTEMLKAQCFQLSDRVHELLWAANPYIFGQAVRFPLSIDCLVRWKGRPGYDWFFPLESLGEFNSESEQGNAYDQQFALCGFDPERISPEYKRPFWGMNEIDLQEIKEWDARPYACFQLRATNVGRTAPLNVLEMILERLEKTGLTVLCMDDLPLKPDVKTLVSAYPNAIDISTKIKNVRQYGALLGKANLVIGPDSSAIHFAAVTGTPCLSLWGPFDPEARVKYYQKHIALWTPEKCPNAPCYNYLQNLPFHKCPDGIKAKHCVVFDGISSQTIDTAITKLLEIKS